jgi:hypothetical protein
VQSVRQRQWTSRRWEHVTQRALVRLGRTLLFSPLVFVAHFLEESPSFVPWFNAHVARGITQELFWSVNLTALLITVLLTVGFWVTRSPPSIAVVVAWLSFLMLTNTLFHVTGAIVDGAYVPGLVSAIILYLPYCTWVAVRVAATRCLPPSLVGTAAFLGGLPMAVHGYRILFLGTRLF